MTSKEIASRIDHSILNPAFTLEDLRNECAVAAKYHTASVCVRRWLRGICRAPA